MEDLLFAIVPTLIFVGVLLLIATADRIVDRFARRRSRKRTRRGSYTHRMRPSRCVRCGNVFPNELLLNGVCIICREWAEKERVSREMKYGWGEEESRIEQYYRLLGCTRTDTDETIKRKYHEIVKRIHPDMLLQQDLPDSAIKANTQKFHDIQEAYEKIMATRKRGT